MTASALETSATAVRNVSLHQGVQQLIANREANIVDQMVMAYRSGKGTYEVLLAKVAAISELREIEAELDRNARNSIEHAARAAGSVS